MANNSRKAQSEIGLYEIYESPAHLIRRIHQISVAIFDSELPKSLKGKQCVPLTAIREFPGIEQQRLAELIAVDRSTLAEMLQRMDERGLVRRVVPGNDRRLKRLYLTSEGKRVVKAASTAHHLVQERILAPLTAAERTEFVKLLTKLVESNNNESRAPVRALPPEDLKPFD